MAIKLIDSPAHRGLEIVHHPHVFVLDIVAMEYQRPTPSSKPHADPGNCIRPQCLSVVIADDVSSPLQSQSAKPFENRTRSGRQQEQLRIEFG